MGMIRLASSALLALLVLPIAPAAACSVVSGYHVPTTLELAEGADTILIGTVEGEEAGKGEFFHQVVIRPSLLLKGAALPDKVTIPGQITDQQRAVTRSAPRELRAPNPDALRGACTRYVYARGMRLVLFLERDKEGALHFAGYPFARVSEDVASNDALWVKAVRLYVDVAKLPLAERKATLIARRDQLRAAEGDPDAQALADDLDLELTDVRTEPRD